MDKEGDLISLLSLDQDFLFELLENLKEGVFILDAERRILLWNDAAAEMTGHARQDVVGRRCSDGVLRHMNENGIILCQGKCPAEATLKDGEVRSIEAFLLHQKGFRLPVLARVIPIYDKDKRIAGVAQIFSDISPKLAVPPRSDFLVHQDMLDPQTELGNKTFLKMCLESRIGEMRKYEIPLGVLLVDIDHLDRVNLNFGRAVGDEVIKNVAITLQKNIRFIDIVGRWEEDTFLVIVLNANEPRLDVVANKLRLLVQSSFVHAEGRMLSVSVSIGAALAQKQESAEEIIGRAEKLMVQSKKLGGNCVSSRLEEF